MTRAARARPRHRGLARPLSVLFCLALCSIAAGGCSPLVTVAAAALSGMTGPAEAPAAGPMAGVPAAGLPSAAQNGAAPDRSVARALELQQQEVDPACAREAARLSQPQPDDPPPGTCRLRPVCLPGAAAPTLLQLCAVPAAQLHARAEPRR